MSVDRYRRKKKSRVPMVLGVIFSLGVLWMMIVATNAVTNSRAKRAAEGKDKRDDSFSIRVDAVIAAKNAVRSKLAFPNNANFHWGYEIKEGVAGPDTWHISGKVDAMNALGAKPTLNWSAIVELVNREPRQFKVIAADATP